MKYCITILLLVAEILEGLTIGTNIKGCQSNVLAQTESGWVCGAQRSAENGKPYASFRGIPYGKQPVGELRFKELQPAESWTDVLNATTEGPICYQGNLLLAEVMGTPPNGVSEGCIYLNVHVPVNALPNPGSKGSSMEGYPVLTFIHGSGWSGGSGNSDLHGPEYLMSYGNVIVITSNYRVGVHGFLSLNSSEIPGNMGLGDNLKMLSWIQRNIAYFGGSPDRVTLAGHSAGAVNAHLIAMSPLSEGLIHGLWIMSGCAMPTSYSTSPEYAYQVSEALLRILGFDRNDPDVHKKLIETPMEVITDASREVIMAGFKGFFPVQQFPLPGVIAIVSDAPEKLLAKGYGDHIPTVFGYVSNECQVSLIRFIIENVIGKYKENKENALPLHYQYILPQKVKEAAGEAIGERYFDGEPTMDKYMQLCMESTYMYPSIKFAEDRIARCGGAPLFFYRFDYESDYSAMKMILNHTFSGATHGEDLALIFKVNSFHIPYSEKDYNMINWMTSLVVHFLETGSPSPGNAWPRLIRNRPFRRQEFITPYEYKITELSEEEKGIIRFYEHIYDDDV